MKMLHCCWQNALIAIGLMIGSGLTASAQVTFASWKTENGIAPGAAANSDSDRDGIPLLLEYALGLSPITSSSDGLPTTTSHLAPREISLIYRSLRTDVLYEVQGSNDLLNWTVMGLSTISLGGDNRQQTSLTLADDQPRKFLRLRVILNNTNATQATIASSNYPTIENLSLDWPVSGDTNRNGIATVRFRKTGDPQWRSGLPLRRVPAGSNVSFSWAERHAGSVFDLTPATSYDIELALDDPDGGSISQRLSVSTRPIPSLPLQPRLRQATSSQTLSALLNTAQAGDIIELQPSATPYSGFTIERDGMAGNPIVLRGTPGAIITGEIGLFSRQHIMLTSLTLNGRIRFNSSENISITRCVINGTTAQNGDGIVCFQRGANCYIADNDIRGLTLWNEAALGVSGANLGEGIIVTGPGHVIQNNRVRGLRDGISFMEEQGAAADQISIDVLNNDISECADDGIEADFAMGNCRIMRNRLTNNFIALSSQPSLGGPTYFIRNVLYHVLHVPFKLYRNSDGDVLLHNVIVKHGDGLNIYSGGPIYRLYSRNNLFLGGPGRSFTSDAYSSGTGRWMDIGTLDVTSADMNYDAFGQARGSTVTTTEARFGSAPVYTSLLSFQNNTTEKQALLTNDTALTPLFNTNVPLPDSGAANALTAYAPPDLRPAPGAAIVGTAQLLPNINDTTLQPSRGAYEPNQPLLIYGVRPLN